MKNQLYILPFDHRSSFLKDILEVENRKPAEDEISKSRELKNIIYEAFKQAVKEGVPKASAGILTDEWLGLGVLKKVKKDRFIFCLPVEKSGQNEFDFEFGKNYKEHIKRWDPDYVKALVRYNPEGDKELNRRQAVRLAELSRYLKKRKNKFMFELLIPPTEDQKIKDYDNKLRPGLAVKAIKQLHLAGVFPDIWKIEGFNKTEDMQKVAEVVKDDRKARIIILGRGENKRHAKIWLKKGAKVDISVGFAIGRTIFLKPLQEYNKGKLSKEKTIKKIKDNYIYFVNIWKKNKI